MYSERLTTWARSGAHAGALPDATHHGQGGVEGHGPFLHLWFRVEEGRVAAARWRAYGCPAAMACGEAVCTVAEGRELDALSTLTAADVTALVGGVPEGKEHCPELAVEAIRTARMLGS